MKFYKCKGNRIRASDKSLVFHFSISILSIIFIILLTVLNVRQIAEIKWKNINLFSENGLSFSLTTYNILTIILAISISLLVAFLYYHYQYDRFKKLIHRQKLARMILENKWYDILLMAISCNKYNDNRQLEKKKEVVEQIKNVYLMEYKELAKCMNKLGL